MLPVSVNTHKSTHSRHVANEFLCVTFIIKSSSSGRAPSPGRHLKTFGISQVYVYVYVCINKFDVVLSQKHRLQNSERYKYGFIVFGKSKSNSWIHDGGRGFYCEKANFQLAFDLLGDLMAISGVIGRVDECSAKGKINFCVCFSDVLNVSQLFWIQ